jgi:hypothetical protein
MISTQTIPEETQTTARPTPEAIDVLAQRWRTAKSYAEAAKEALQSIEEEAAELVRNFGIVVPNAEKSRRLNGRHSEFTLTKSDTITIDDERVEDLKAALEANSRADIFSRLFTVRSKYEVVDGADQVMRTETVSKRLSERIFSLFGRCIRVKANKPKLKVVLFDPSAPPKKSRAKKGGE